MDTSSSSSNPSESAKRRGFWLRITGSKVLMISILVHILFGVGATYLIVQRAQRRKVTFQGGPPATNRSQRALEHKVAVAQKKKTGGAPSQAKRIVTTGLAQISLPEMPSISSATSVTSGMTAGMGGAGFGQGMGFGSGMGAGANGGGSGGSPFSLFGLRSAGNSTFAGTFYDLKQSRSRRPTDIGNEDPMTPKYWDVLASFLKANFNESVLNDFFRAPHKLYATQFMMPNMKAEEGPKAFGVDRYVNPSRWVAVYRGKVSPPKTGTYHFIGGGDDYLLVRFNGQLVVDSSYYNVVANLKPDGESPMSYSSFLPKPFRSEGIKVNAGEYYDMEVLIGERPGGEFWACLWVEEEGAPQKKDDKGNILLPLFRTAAAKIPGNIEKVPPFDPDGPVWKTPPPKSNSLLDALKQ